MGDEWPVYETDENKEYRFKPICGKTLRFTVQAAHNAHLCFSTAPEITTPMIEVFLGAWDNAGSAVRFVEDIVKIDSPDILSADEAREFWIAFDTNRVKVGRGGEWEPMMECALPEQYDPTFFGYSTGWGSTGVWQFFCERPCVPTEDALTYEFSPIYGDTFTFAVSCANDAHVALTTGPEETQPMVELFIGGWSNQCSAIRLDKDREQTVAKVDTPDICCCGEEKTFTVSFKDGHVKVTKQGETHPFMEHSLEAPFKVTHVGVGTGWGATGTWKLEV